MILAVVVAWKSVDIMHTVVVPTLIRRGFAARVLRQYISDLATSKDGIIVGEIPL